MSIRVSLLTAAVLTASPVLAQMGVTHPGMVPSSPPAMASNMPAPSPAMFVAKAGASDEFEIRSAKLAARSTNPAIKSFATQMIADHTKSTADIKMAAKADGLTVRPPMLDKMQVRDLSQLTAAKGKARDALYVRQQKPAHEKALALMQSYSASGSATHLKMTAGEIVPTVQGHLDMLNQMPTM